MKKEGLFARTGIQEEHRFPDNLISIRPTTEAERRIEGREYVTHRLISMPS